MNKKKNRCLTKSGERQALGDDVLKGRLDVATYLVHGVVEKHGRGERDRVNFSKVRVSIIMTALLQYL